jgi:hypothetical protein
MRILRRNALDSEGAYREVARYGPTVELEVLSAPGLRPGTHVHVTAAAARSMTPHARRASERASRLAGLATRFVLGHSPKLKLPTA